jgi:hypothetical protein
MSSNDDARMQALSECTIEDVTGSNEAVAAGEPDSMVPIWSGGTHVTLDDLDDYNRQFFRNMPIGRGCEPILVRGGAGTGKTHEIKEKVKVSEGKCALIYFNKGITKKVFDETRNVGNLEPKTMHALAYAAKYPDRPSQRDEDKAEAALWKAISEDRDLRSSVEEIFRANEHLFRDNRYKNEVVMKETLPKYIGETALDMMTKGCFGWKASRSDVKRFIWEFLNCFGCDRILREVGEGKQKQVGRWLEECYDKDVRSKLKHKEPRKRVKEFVAQDLFNQPGLSHGVKSLFANLRSFLLTNEKIGTGEVWTQNTNILSVAFDPAVREVIYSDYGVIFIDEAQDLLPCLLPLCFENFSTQPFVPVAGPDKPQFIFLGDPDQSINQFLDCVNVFEPGTLDCRHLRFHRCFRYGKDILQTIGRFCPSLDLHLTPSEQSKTDIVDVSTADTSTADGVKCQHLIRSVELCGRVTILAYGWRNLLHMMGIWGMYYTFSTKFKDFAGFAKFVREKKPFLSQENLEKLEPNFRPADAEDAKLVFSTAHTGKGLTMRAVHMHSDIFSKSDNLVYTSFSRVEGSSDCDAYPCRLTFNGRQALKNIMNKWEPPAEFWQKDWQNVQRKSKRQRTLGSFFGK